MWEAQKETLSISLLSHYFQGDSAPLPIPVPEQHVGWWLPCAGTVGTLYGHLSGQDLAARTHLTPSWKQVTGSA